MIIMLCCLDVIIRLQIIHGTKKQGRYFNFNIHLIGFDCLDFTMFFFQCLRENAGGG